MFGSGNAPSSAHADDSPEEFWGNPTQWSGNASIQPTALGDTGELNGGQTNSLLVKLEMAASAINRGKDNVACNILAAFIDHVTDLIYSDGVLTEAEGLPLIDSAASARAALGCAPARESTGAKMGRKSVREH